MSGAQGLTVSELIFTLQRYWADRGCVLTQPYDLEMGAGTFHPDTFLRVLGPEAWATVYAQACRRPRDGRYGKNPNRLQHYYQLQVLVKPPPDSFLAMYRGSLEAVGIRPAEHDLRFLEDDWESPTLGAAGLGWQVWLDGLEITQVTYFQQAGGIELSPVTGELTYGIERLAMYLQGTESIFDLRWNESVTYGDLFLRNEQEFSRYGFEAADVVRLRSDFDAVEADTLRLLKDGLTLPAYDGVIRASHLFNLLDARRAVSVTDRAGFIGRVRRMARRAAESYVKVRESLEHPLAGKIRIAEPAPPVPRPASSEAAEPGEALLELGVEDLPAAWVENLAQQMHARAKAALEEARLVPASLASFGTPRRLVLVLKGLPASSAVVSEEQRGPAWKAAYDAMGKPTAAALGFAKAAGADPSAFRKLETPKGEYVVVTVSRGGKAASEVLPGVFQAAVSGLSFPKAMRWREDGFRFGRPLRRVLAIHEGRPLPLPSLPNVTHTVPHEALDPAAVEIRSVAGFERALAPHVELSFEKRLQRIEAAIATAAEEAGGEVVPDIALAKLLAGATESPAIAVGSYDPRFLEMPLELIVTTLREHQMAFSVRARNQRLLPKFLTVYDGDPAIAARIRVGHERVVHARLSDAAFFWDEDRKRPMVEHEELLRGVAWHAKLGSLHDKTERVRRLCARLSRLVPSITDEKTRDLLDRAARLYKVDQTSLLIGEKEFSSLQGIVGRALALASEEPSDVADAIEESYEPRDARRNLPDSDIGAILGVADRLDSIVGLLAAGEAPTGSEDPLGIRRDALAVLLILRQFDWKAPLAEWLDAAGDGYRAPVAGPPLEGHAIDRATEAAAALFASRLEGLLGEDGQAPDEIQAVLGRGLDSVPGVFLRARAIQELRRTPAFADSAQSFLRVFNLLAKERYDASDAPPDPALFETAEEKALWGSVQEVAPAASDAAAAEDFGRLSGLLSALRMPIDRFFETTMVMTDDAAKQKNRIALLRAARRMLLLLCDFRALTPGTR